MTVVDGPAAKPTYDLSSDRFFADPFGTLDLMRRRDPVYWHPTMGMWVLTRYRHVHLLSHDPNFSAERVDAFFLGTTMELQPRVPVVRDYFAKWMVLMDPPAHTRIRTLVNKAFSPRAVARLRSDIEVLVETAISSWTSGDRVDVVGDLGLPLSSEVIARMLGVPTGDMDDFRRWTGEAFRVVTLIGDPEENLNAARRGVLELTEYLLSRIAERRTSPRSDILSDLVHAADGEDSLSEAELVATCGMLLNAALETTSSLIANAVLALAEHPAELAKLRRDPGLINRTVEETLRYNGAAPGILRVAKSEQQIGNQEVKAGDLLLGMTHAANRDPDVFDRPEDFLIERAEVSRHLGFAHGPHVCLGASLARLETQVAVGMLVERFKNLSLAVNPAQLSWLHSLAVRGVQSLPVLL